MKKISLLLPICAALALSGCFMSQKSQIVHRDVPYNEQNQARLRIYGQYGRDVVRMIPNSTCEQWAEKQGRRRHTRFTGGLPRRIRNLSVGMPATQRSNTVNADTGVVFRESYKEFVVPAGKPLVLDGAFSSETLGRVDRCRLAASLTPQPGKDYEVQYSRDGEGCDVAVVEILPQTNGEVHPTRPASIQYCPMPATSY
ncbi:hypothetical protein [Eikenella halliae]|uniref:Lipoprotein n=1 Tax=Eikenella halliae TaxID=1795832 RepID=A0A1B6VXD8_9NEIS|nr:hypothetical protein [Eikenella halliae]OAM41495.1 hypothetical protein A7Q00_07985 [Eikenella halliae]